MNDFIVYKHTSPSGKVYIGITSQSPSKRWKNGLGYKDNPLFYKAIKKYGWENFSHEILFDSLCKKDAEEIEIMLISEYQSTKRENGYNLAPGGMVTSPTNESREKTRKSMTKRWEDPAYKEKTQMAMRGIKRSPFARKNISIAQKKRFLDPAEKARIYANIANEKSIICLETGEVFTSIISAGRKYGIDSANINAVCKGKRKTAGGFSWEYSEIGEQLKNGTL